MDFRFQRLLSLCAMVGWGLLLSGCGSSYTPAKLVAVRGTVTVDDVPVRGGDIEFYPDESAENHSSFLAQGTIDKSGKYELYTSGMKGAPPGPYVVVVTSPNLAGPTGTEKASKPRLLVKDKYRHRHKSDLLVKVVERPKEGQYDLKLER